MCRGVVAISPAAPVAGNVEKTRFSLASRRRRNPFAAPAASSHFSTMPCCRVLSRVGRIQAATVREPVRLSDGELGTEMYCRLAWLNEKLLKFPGGTAGAVAIVVAPPL